MWRFCRHKSQTTGNLERLLVWENDRVWITWDVLKIRSRSFEWITEKTWPVSLSFWTDATPSSFGGCSLMRQYPENGTTFQSAKIRWTFTVQTVSSWQETDSIPEQKSTTSLQLEKLTGQILTITTNWRVTSAIRKIWRYFLWIYPHMTLYRNQKNELNRDTNCRNSHLTNCLYNQRLHYAATRNPHRSNRVSY